MQNAGWVERNETLMLQESRKGCPMTWKSKIGEFDPGEIPPEAVAMGAALLAGGGVLVYPTETFYALGAVPSINSAVDRIFAIKGRDEGKPLPLIASGKEAVSSAVSGWPEAADKLARAFWPGPLTLILPASPSLPGALHAGTGKVAIRVSGHPVATLLAESAGGLLVSTSANRSGGLPPAGPEEMDAVLLSLVDGFINAGNLPGGLASTIVDVDVFPPRLVREGAVDRETVRRVLSGLLD